MKKRLFPRLILSLALLTLTAVIFVGGLLLRHEKWQSQQIHSLKSEVGLLTNSVNDIQKRQKSLQYSKSTFNYLALGNSITVHPLSEYWWNEIGMAASNEEHDYYHIVLHYLQNKYGAVTSYVYNFAVWEEQSHDRSEAILLIDKYLDSHLDLITIQLSENANDLETFTEDYKELIKYIHDRCPKAQIIMIDDFWDDKKSMLKKNIARNCNINFVDLSKIRDDIQYQSFIGASVLGQDGSIHYVDHAGVAKHPGDYGMDYIAQRVIEQIE